MISSEVQRTLVKSPPELWAELSDQDALARHLGAFGEIRITKVDPEKAVEWEAERASGSVRIKASGWGTRVTLSASRELDVEAGEAANEDLTSPVGSEADASAGGGDPAEDLRADAAVGGAPEVEAPTVEQVEAHAAEAPTVDPQTEEAPAADAAVAEPPVPEKAAPDAHADEAPAAAPTVEEAQAADEPAPAAEAQAPRRRGFFARLFGLGRSEQRHATAPAREPGPDLEVVRAAAALAISAALADRTEPAAGIEQAGGAQPAEKPAPASVAQTVSAMDGGDASEVTPAHESASPAHEPEAPANELALVQAAEHRAGAPEADEDTPDGTGPEAAAAALAAIRASAAAGGETALPYGSAEKPGADAQTPRDIGAELRAAEEAAVEEIVAVLTGVLDRLGAAHHRPFSRA